MSGPVILSGQTAAALAEVAKFFGIDMEWNRHIFRHAASRDPVAFATVIAAMAEACRQDVRFGINERIAARISERKAR